MKLFRKRTFKNKAGFIQGREADKPSTQSQTKHASPSLQAIQQLRKKTSSNRTSNSNRTTSSHRTTSSSHTATRRRRHGNALKTRGRPAALPRRR